jgi:formylglycine-generating enzyme required for sulfatase activity
MEFVTIQPGSFRMGCAEGDTNCDPDENPPHQVRITKSFQLGKHEVTQAQWVSVMGATLNLSRFKGDTLPAENMTYFQVEEFLKRLNARNDGFTYRLPTEAEWEYAARAGTTGPNTGPLNDVAWHMGNSGGKTHPVGGKKPNAWGLHDMEGNVYEWTSDWFFDYEEDPLTDPKGPDTGFEKVPRGGAWESTPKGVRTSNRNKLEPDGESYLIGFRLARVPAAPAPRP